MTRRVLTGWGLTPASASEVISPVSAADMEAALVKPRRGVLGRGLGRSYGDAALNAGGTVVDATSLSRFHRLDADGTLVADAGVSIDAVTRAVLPHGWFVPVTPGTRFVTLGGALAADVHGKNHHVEGAFADHVRGFTLHAPTGTRHVTPEGDPEVFAATAGGMGLTGLISDVELSLLAVETSRMRVDTERTADLDDCMARMSAGDDAYRYSVAWIDLTARGRGVLTRGDHATLAELGDGDRRDPLAFGGSQLASVPPVVPSGVLNRWTVKAFNTAWYLRHPRSETGAIQSIPSFFHPLDAVGSWNRVYGSRGFVQYQLAVPFGAEATLRRVAERLSVDAPSFLTVLKRFGPGRGWLSFPIEGWTLALDVPAGVAGLADLLDRCDDDVLAAGGRVYLAKDARVRPRVFAAMYPDLERWRAVRDRLDPDGLLRSDLARRLGLVPATEPRGPA